jgi:hypothetical protein
MMSSSHGTGTPDALETLGLVRYATKPTDRIVSPFALTPDQISNRDRETTHP